MIFATVGFSFAPHEMVGPIQRGDVGLGSDHCRLSDARVMSQVRCHVQPEISASIEMVQSSGGCLDTPAVWHGNAIEVPGRNGLGGDAGRGDPWCPVCGSGGDVPCGDWPGADDPGTGNDRDSGRGVSVWSLLV